MNLHVGIRPIEIRDRRFHRNGLRHVIDRHRMVRKDRVRGEKKTSNYNEARKKLGLHRNPSTLCRRSRPEFRFFLILLVDPKAKLSNYALRAKLGDLLRAGSQLALRDWLEILRAGAEADGAEISLPRASARPARGSGPRSSRRCGCSLTRSTG